MDKGNIGVEVLALQIDRGRADTNIVPGRLLQEVRGPHHAKPSELDGTQADKAMVEAEGTKVPKHAVCQSMEEPRVKGRLG